MKLRLALPLACASTLIAGSALAQPSVKHIPAPGGDVVILDANGRAAYDGFHYAPARRAGDYLYISGVVVGRRPDGPRTPDTFAASARSAFERIRVILAAYGLTFDDVVMVNSFHDWSAPEFDGDRLRQFKAFDAVKETFMTGVHPAWTAVGTSGLISTNGVVEVQMIAYAPARPTRSR